MGDRATPEPDLISLVIPVYNEQESLRPLAAEIAAAVQGLRTEIWFVDDGSTDASWTTVLELAQQNPSIRGLRFRRNFGKAAALQAGFERARGRIVLTLDADLQDDPKEILRFIEAIDGGLDVVSGWKKLRHDPWHKVMPSRLFNWTVSTVTGVSLHDHNCGFKAYRASVLPEIRLYGELHRFIPVLAAGRGFKSGELVIHHRARKFGHSKYGVRRFIKGLLDLASVRFVTGFGHRPQHFLGTLGLPAVLLGFFGFLVLFLNMILRWIAPEYGLEPVGQMIGAVVAVGLLLLGSQLLIAGLVAELLVDRVPGRLEPFSIAEVAGSQP